MKYLLLLLTLVAACKTPDEKTSAHNRSEIDSTAIQSTAVIVLGTVQDAGAPQIGCTKDCCKNLFNHPELHRSVVALGLVDPENKKKYLFECTPDFSMQAKQLRNASNNHATEMPDGIFLTHAHIGHYSGLMYLGKEAANADAVPVYAMPRMQTFIKNNGPWSQLVTNNNIALKPLAENQKATLSDHLAVTPVVVPHRDEFSETVGYMIEGLTKKLLFIPDIDKWEKWSTSIIEMIAKVDYAFIDGTFYDAAEINNRNIAEIPHPFIIESMELFKNLPASEKNKIHFIHFNHTNQVLDENSTAYKTVLTNGFHIARMGQVVKL